MMVRQILAAALAGCGSPDETSGDSSTSSLWIQTDLAGADLDSDGRTDIVTIATLQQSFGVNEGTLKIYRQTTPGAFVASTIRIGSGVKRPPKAGEATRNAPIRSMANRNCVNQPVSAPISIAGSGKPPSISRPWCGWCASAGCSRRTG